MVTKYINLCTTTQENLTNVQCTYQFNSYNTNSSLTFLSFFILNSKFGKIGVIIYKNDTTKYLHLV